MTEQLLPEPLLCARIVTQLMLSPTKVEVHSAEPRYDIEGTGLYAVRQLAEAVGLGHDHFIVNNQACRGRADTTIRGTAVCGPCAATELWGQAGRL